MNKRIAKKIACAIAARQIDCYIDAGQPLADLTDGLNEWSTAECDKIVTSLEELRDESDSRSAGVSNESMGKLDWRPA